MTGFYLMHRGWQDNPAFNNEPFSRRDAWVWLIETANYADGRWSVSGRTITLKRGQLCRPLRKIAEAWQWDEAKVRRFLSRLKQEEMIECVTDAKSTVITVCNYDEYQPGGRVADATTDAKLTHDRRVTDAPKNEGKELSKEADASLGEGSAPAVPPKMGARSNPARQANPVPKSTRLPTDWALPDDWRSWAAAEGVAPEIIAREAEKFRDHWFAKSGADGRKNDWFATWRNWIRRAREGGYGRRGGHSGGAESRGQGFLELRREQAAGAGFGDTDDLHAGGGGADVLEGAFVRVA